MKIKETIILLHGALGTSFQLKQLNNKLIEDFTVCIFDFEGHGENESEREFSIELFVQNTLDFMDINNIQSAHFFGYSMGGYVALKLASLNPEKVLTITTYGTKFDWTPESAEKEMRMLNPDKIEEKVPKFAQMLEKLHIANDWKNVVSKTAEMMWKLGNKPVLSTADLKSINIAVSLCLGTEDQMVTVQETKEIKEQLSNSSFYSIENSAHAIESVDLNELRKIIHTTVDNLSPN